MQTLTEVLTPMLATGRGPKKTLVPMIFVVVLFSLNVFADDAEELFDAANRGDASGVESLIEKGVDVDEANRHGVTPLGIASQQGHTEVVELLLAAQADVNHATKAGLTSLLVASALGHTEVARLLLAAEADVNKATTAGVTPLMIASREGHTEVVRLLLADGADVNKAEADGLTPLHMAAGKGRIEAARLLLAAEADVNKATTAGVTPLIIPLQEGHTEVVKLLLAAGAEVNAEFEHQGETYSALSVAQKNGHTHLATLLGEHGRVQGYEVGKTTEVQFVNDGWNSTNPYEGRLGIMGVGCNLLRKGDLDDPPMSGPNSECQVLLGYAPCKVIESRLDSNFESGIDEYIESAKNRRFDYSGILLIPVFLKAWSTREEVEQDETLRKLHSKGIATYAKACSESSHASNSNGGVLVPTHYFVLHFRDGVLQRKSEIQIP